MANVIPKISRENFQTGSGWTIVGAGNLRSADAAIAPDGTLTADRLYDDNGGGTIVGGLVLQVPLLKPSTQYCWAWFVKKDQLDWCAWRTQNFTVPSNTQSFFDHATPVIMNKSAAHDAIGVIEYESLEGTDWVRCYGVFTLDTDVDGDCRIYKSENGNLSVPRDGTSSFFVWGVSLNEGDYPEPYTSNAGITIDGPSGSSGMGLSFGKMGMR